MLPPCRWLGSSQAPELPSHPASPVGWPGGCRASVSPPLQRQSHTQVGSPPGRQLNCRLPHPEGGGQRQHLSKLRHLGEAERARRRAASGPGRSCCQLSLPGTPWLLCPQALAVPPRGAISSSTAWRCHLPVWGAFGKAGHQQCPLLPGREGARGQTRGRVMGTGLRPTREAPLSFSRPGPPLPLPRAGAVRLAPGPTAAVLAPEPAAAKSCFFFLLFFQSNWQVPLPAAASRDLRRRRPRRAPHAPACSRSTCEGEYRHRLPSRHVGTGRRAPARRRVLVAPAG